MRTKTILLAVLVSLSATTAIARGIYPPIPLDHWSYNSLEYLASEGFLPSAHMESFDRNEELNLLDMGEYAKLVKRIFDLGQPDCVSSEAWRTARMHASEFTQEYGYLLKGDVTQEVQLDHWSYDALDYLSQTRFLEGYPEGYFTSGKSLTRYDFAQATGRFLDSMTSEPDDWMVIVLSNALIDEFGDLISDTCTGISLIRHD